MTISHTTRMSLHAAQSTRPLTTTDASDARREGEPDVPPGACGARTAHGLAALSVTPRLGRGALLVGAMLLACVLPSCGLFGLTDEEAADLAFYQENSAVYYEAGRYAQALELIDNGLALDPDNYKLLSTQAWCYLRQVEANPALLGRCEQLFDSLYAKRAPRDHGAPALLGQGETQKQLGVRHLERARELRTVAIADDRDATARTIAAAEADEHGRIAQFHFVRAREALQALLANESSMRVAHKQLMDIATVTEDYEGAVRHGLACIELNHKEQAMRLEQIRRTMEVQEERAARALYQDLVDQEARVRSALAERPSRKDDFSSALVQLDELLRIDPTRSTDYYNRARVLQALGRDDDARRDYQKFLTSTNLTAGHEKYARALEFTQRPPLDGR